MNDFEQVSRAIKACQGYMIHLLSLSLVEEANSLQIRLRWGPSKPDSVLSCQNILYFKIGRFPDAEFGPLDSLTATALPPADEPWPDGLDYDLVRTSSLPPLLWIRAEGPVQLDILAASVTMFSEVTH